jgi:hypothetical protein
VRNSCLVFDDHGERIARYDKMHLFGFESGSERYCESDTIEPGSGPPLTCSTGSGLRATAAESIHLDGAFAVGTHGTTKALGQAPRQWTISELDPYRSGTIEMVLDGAVFSNSMKFDSISNERSRITQRMALDGEGAHMLFEGIRAFEATAPQGGEGFSFAEPARVPVEPSLEPWITKPIGFLNRRPAEPSTGGAEMVASKQRCSTLHNRFSNHRPSRRQALAIAFPTDRC